MRAHVKPRLLNTISTMQQIVAIHSNGVVVMGLYHLKPWMSVNNVNVNDMKHLPTGKNKEQFKLFLLNSDYHRAHPLGYKITYDHFIKYPFEMQSGVLTAYYDSVGMKITLNYFEASKWRKPQKDYWEWRICYHDQYGIEYSRPEAQTKAFEQANELMNEKLK